VKKKKIEKVFEKKKMYYSQVESGVISNLSSEMSSKIMKMIESEVNKKLNDYLFEFIVYNYENGVRDVQFVRPDDEEIHKQIATYTTMRPFVFEEKVVGEKKRMGRPKKNEKITIVEGEEDMKVSAENHSESNDVVLAGVEEIPLEEKEKKVEKEEKKEKPEKAPKEKKEKVPKEKKEKVPKEKKEKPEKVPKEKKEKPEKVPKEKKEKPEKVPKEKKEKKEKSDSGDEGGAKKRGRPKKDEKKEEVKLEEEIPVVADAAPVQQTEALAEEVKEENYEESDEEEEEEEEEQKPKEVTKFTDKTTGIDYIVDKSKVLEVFPLDGETWYAVINSSNGKLAGRSNLKRVEMYDEDSDDEEEEDEEEEEEEEE